MTPVVGVILPERIVMTSRDSFPIDDFPPTIGAMHALARRHGIRQLWLTPAIVEAIGLPAELPRTPAESAFLDPGSRAVPKLQDTLSPWLSIWGDHHYLEVAIPSWDRGSPFSSCTFGPSLIGEVLEFTEATGMLWRRSGAITSDAWLREHYKGKLAPTQYPEIAERGNLEPDLHFSAAVRPEESRARYCHAFDANAMYLGAASSLALPVGSFSHYQGGEPVNAEAMVNGAPGYRRFDDVWMTGPAASYDQAGTIPDEAYFWHESHRYLEPWYKVLRDARKALLPHGSSPALDAVKSVYRQGIGRLGSTRRTVESDPLYQPYWRHAVQAEARCRLMRRIDKLTEKPIAVDVDCLYFLTNSRSPAAFAKKIGLPLGDEIGQFKVAGTQLGKAARDAIASGSDELAQLRLGMAA